MQHRTVTENYVGAQAAASFPMVRRQVVILADLQRKAAQGHVSIWSTMQRTVLSKTPFITLQFAVNLSGLIKLWPAVLYVENFLESHHVGIKFGDHGCDALRTGTPVNPSAFMDVVGGEANADSHC